MELVDKDETVAISVVSVTEEQGGDTCESLAINQAAYLSDFSSNMISLLRKFDHKSSDYLKRMQVVLDDLSRLDHQINLTKRGFRKRMRSAVDTSTELSEKIRRIEEKAREEEDLEEEESDLEEEEEEGEEENCVNEESDENANEVEFEDENEGVDEEEGGDD